MRTLDRYIVRNFLITAALCFLILMSLRVVADLFFNMDEFTEQSDFLHGTIRDIGSYYGHHSLVYFIELGGVIIVAAAAFTIAYMNHTNELTAMLASGVSLYRVVWPVILCAMLAGGLVILDQELLIPRVAHKLVRQRDDVPGTEQFRVRAIPDGTGAVWWSPRFLPTDEVMDAPLVIVRSRDPKDPKGRQELARIPGRKAYPAKNGAGWIIEDGALTRPGRNGNPWPNMPNVQRVWTRAGPEAILAKVPEDILAKVREVFRKRRARTLPVEGLFWVTRPRVIDTQYALVITADRFVPNIDADGRAAGGTLIQPRFEFKAELDANKQGQTLGIFLAESARWQPGGQQGHSFWQLDKGRLLYPTDLTPGDLVLRQSSHWLEFMSTSQLTELVKLKRVPNRKMAMVTKHVRVTNPINNLVMLLLGLPFILSRERNIKASATLCVLVVLAFYLFIYFCRNVDVNPTLAAWLPTLLFGPLAVVMLDTIKT